MDKDFFDLYNNFNSSINLGMKMDIREFLEEDDRIKSWKIGVDKRNVFMIKVELHHFSNNNCHRLFYEFMSYICYSHINLFICREESKQMKYFYITQAEDFEGIKMEVVIE